MNIKDEKNNLKLEIKQILNNDNIVLDDRLIWYLNELYDDINNDSFNIVVLGEFKRGKSTFINALLGQSLLPMDVLPETAVISEISYGDKSEVNVLYNDGHRQKGEVSYEYLDNFSARKEKSVIDDVKCIEIKYPMEFLKDNIVLVDTPGVSDLSEQRVEITYNYVPKANAVIFLLDAGAPLKKTEYDFIQDKLIPIGINNIIFIANRYDVVDEEEEPDYVPELKQRILNAFDIDDETAKLKDITIYPLSAKLALQGLESNNEELVEASGIDVIRQKLYKMLASGNIEQEKILMYKSRYQRLLQKILHSMNENKSLYSMDRQKLLEISKNLANIKDAAKKNETSIENYVAEVKEQIFTMTDKSLGYFNNKLKENVIDMIDVYQGEGFKEYAEITVAKNIKNNYENWVAVYSGHIDNLLNKLEQELSQGLSVYFKEKINVKTDAGSEINDSNFQIQVAADDISGVNVEVGAKAAAISIGLFAIAGGGLLPLISFAALPYMREKILKERLATAKASLKPELIGQIAMCSRQLQNEVHKYIDDKCNKIIKNTEFAYEKLLADLEARINDKINERADQSNNITEKIKQLDNGIAAIEKKVLLLK